MKKTRYKSGFTFSDKSSSAPNNLQYLCVKFVLLRSKNYGDTGWNTNFLDPKHTRHTRVCGELEEQEEEIKKKKLNDNGRNR